MFSTELHLQPIDHSMRFPTAIKVLFVQDRAADSIKFSRKSCAAAGSVATEDPLLTSLSVVVSVVSGVDGVSKTRMLLLSWRKIYWRGGSAYSND